MSWPIAVLLTGAVGIYGAYTKWKTNKLMAELDQLLDSAIAEKEFTVTFSESYGSKLRNKLRQFIDNQTLKREKFNQEQQNIQGLISNIAHQTKTPLTNISVYSELLLEQGLTEPALDYVTEIAQQTNKLNFLIENLVKTSYLEQELIQLKPTKHSLTQMLAAVRQTALPAAQQKQIAIYFDESNELSTDFDRRWTTEALLNIITNAVKYSPEQTMITLTLNELESFYRIDVIDQGVGIAEAEQGHIFERFYRGQQTQRQDGLGIGLFLAREIIQIQGGFIKVASSDTGTTFSIFLRK